MRHILSQCTQLYQNPPFLANMRQNQAFLATVVEWFLWKIVIEVTLSFITLLTAMECQMISTPENELSPLTFKASQEYAMISSKKTFFQISTQRKLKQILTCYHWIWQISCQDKYHPSMAKYLSVPLWFLIQVNAYIFLKMKDVCLALK